MWEGIRSPGRTKTSVPLVPKQRSWPRRFSDSSGWETGVQSTQLPLGDLPTQTPRPELMELRANSKPSPQIGHHPLILIPKGTGHRKGWWGAAGKVSTGETRLSFKRCCFPRTARLRPPSQTVRGAGGGKNRHPSRTPGSGGSPACPSRRPGSLALRRKPPRSRGARLVLASGAGAEAAAAFLSRSAPPQAPPFPPADGPRPHLKGGADGLPRGHAPSPTLPLSWREAAWDCAPSWLGRKSLSWGGGEPGFNPMPVKFYGPTDPAFIPVRCSTYSLEPTFVSNHLLPKLVSVLAL